jgi:hypothetical protein
MPNCPICNVFVKQLHTSHLKKHNTTVAEIKLLYPDVSFRNENTYAIQREKKLKRVQESNVRCCNCDALIACVGRSTRKFCSQSCSASYNNTHREKKTCTTTCTVCNKQYEISTRGLKLSKFCSSKCSGASRRKPRIDTQCDQCNKTYSTKQSVYNKSVNHFCGNDCKALFYKANPHIRGTYAGYNGLSKVSSYRKLAFETFEHRCHVCNYDRFEDVLQVHHIDHNRSNNDITNLVIVCPTCHSELHKGYATLLNTTG